MKNGNKKDEKNKEKKDEPVKKSNKTSTKEKQQPKKEIEKQPSTKVEDEPKFKQVHKSSKDFDKDEYLKKKKFKKIKIISVSVLVIIILMLSVIFAIINMGNENILNGITIQGIDVSGLNKEKAMDKLKKIYEDKLSSEIEIKYGEYESAVDLKLLETKYEIEKAVDEAIGTGRDGNIFSNNFDIIKTYLSKKNIPIEFSINEDVASQTLEDIGAKLPGIVEESSHYIEDKNLIVDKGKQGIVIDKDKLLSEVKDEINKTEITQEYLDIPTINKDPEPIDINKIHDEVFTEVKDAYYTKNPFEVHPEVEGIDFDVEKAKEILAEEGKEEYTIPLIITKPKVTLAQIGTEAFPDQLATFTTKYDASNKDRTTNLKLACQKINGKVLLPGETFSYNQTLGKRTAEAGYKNGKVYENGQVVDGIGGGICQISSTLYNTVLMANLEIVERRNHQFVTSYLPAGRDATVVYGSTDFKFKNTRKYPVRIVANINSGVATVSMFGIKEEKEYVVSFNTKTISTIPPTTKYEVDPSLPAGQEKVKQKGSNGLVSETYITKKLDGKIVSTKLLSRDTYSAMQKIILKGGTSKASAQPNTTAPANEEPKTETTPAPAAPAQPQASQPPADTEPKTDTTTTQDGATN